MPRAARPLDPCPCPGDRTGARGRTRRSCSCGARGSAPTSSRRRDLAVFSLGRLPDDAAGRRRAEDLARRLDAFLDGRRMTYGEAGRGLGVHPNSLQVRRADRDRADPVGRGTPAHRLDRARRRTSTPATRASSSRADTSTSSVRRRPRHSRSGPGSGRRRRPGRVRGARRIADGGADAHRRGVDPERRRADVPRPRPDSRRRHGSSRAATRTSSCRAPIGSSWSPTPTTVASSGPRGSGPAPSSWRARSSGRGAARGPDVTIGSWRRLTPPEREAVEAEAASLPLPDVGRPVRVRWGA